MFFKIGIQLIAYDLFNQSTDIGITQFCLGLTFKLGIGQLNGNNGSNTFPAIFTGNLVIALNDTVLCTVGIEYTGQRSFKAGFMHTAFGGIDLVGKAQHGFVVAIVILQRNFCTGITLHAAHIDNIIMDRCLIPVAPGYKFTDTAFIAHGILDCFIGAFIGNADPQTGSQKCLFPHTGMQDLIVINGIIEHLRIRLEGNFRSGLVSFTHDGHFLGDMTPGKLHFIDVAFLIYPYPQPFGQGIYNRRTNTVQTAGNFITATAEFTAGMQHGKYNFQRRLSGLCLDINRDTTTIVGDSNGITGIDGHSNIFTVSGQSFIDRVIHDLIDQVMQTGRGSRTDIHTGTFPHCFQTLQNLDLLRTVFLCYFQFVRHTCPPCSEQPCSLLFIHDSSGLDSDVFT